MQSKVKVTQKYAQTTSFFQFPSTEPTHKLSLGYSRRYSFKVPCSGTELETRCLDSKPLDYVATPASIHMSKQHLAKWKLFLKIIGLVRGAMAVSIAILSTSRARGREKTFIRLGPDFGTNLKAPNDQLRDRLDIFAHPHQINKSSLSPSGFQTLSVN